MDIREKVFLVTNGKCFYCGKKLNFNNYHIDHFIPKSKGGKGGDNLVPSCPDCNLFKFNSDIEEFRQRIGDLLDKDIKGRMIKNFCGIKQRKITFYFEK